jgi:hypothetical protein
VTVTGVNDNVVDGNIGYTIITTLATSAGGTYQGQRVEDVSVTNLDDEIVGVKVTGEFKELKEKIEELSNQVDPRKHKMVRPNKEVEFLFDSVIGDSYSPKEINHGFKYKGYPITKIEDFHWTGYRTFWKLGKKTRVYYRKKLVDTLSEINETLIDEALEKPSKIDKVNYIVAKVKELLPASYKKSQAEKICESFKDKLLYLLEDPEGDLKAETAQEYFMRAVIENEEDGKDVLSDSEAIEYKMIAVEKVLGLEPGGNDDIIERIEGAHKEIKNYDWARDYLRFGILANYIPDLEATAASISLSAYPSYRRFMPGTFDPLRRMSFFFAVGTATTEGSKWESEGIVYSYGLGIDLVKGVALNIGRSLYSAREIGSEHYELDKSWSFGICLSSELWRGLLGK